MANRVGTLSKLNYIGILTVLVITTIQASATTVGGTISTNSKWSTINNPYVMTGAVTIAQGVTLTVDPGVQIQGRTNLAFTVNGTLWAVGTSNAPITFTKDPTVSKASAIQVVGTAAATMSATGMFQFCEFSYLTNWNSSISGLFSVVSVLDCKFTNMMSAQMIPGVTSSYIGVRLNDSKLIMERSRLSLAGSAVDVRNGYGVVSSNVASSAGDLLYLHNFHTASPTNVWTVAYNTLGPCGDDTIDLGGFSNTQHFVIGNLASNGTDKTINLTDMRAIIRNNIVWNSRTAMGVDGRINLDCANNTFVTCTNGISFTTTDTSTSLVVNTIVWNILGDTAPVSSNLLLLFSHCDIQAGAPNGTFNVDADPLFFSMTDGTFRLATNSPCLDTGTNQLWMTNAVDFYGSNRVQDLIVDMGAIEGPVRGASSTIYGTPVDWLKQNVTNDNPDYAGLELSDLDGDGFPAWKEYIAGTGAKDSNSVFHIIKVEESIGNQFKVYWSSVDHANADIVPLYRRYTLYNSRYPTNVYATNNVVTNNIHPTIDGTNIFLVPIPTNRGNYWGLTVSVTN